MADYSWDDRFPGLLPFRCLEQSFLDEGLVEFEDSLRLDQQVYRVMEMIQAYDPGATHGSNPRFS